MNNDKAIAKVAVANKIAQTEPSKKPVKGVTVSGVSSPQSPTMGRRAYENDDYISESGVFSYNEKEFSFGAGAAIAIVKSRLVKLMGSDVIRILDREWINLLGARIQLQYEEELRLQERRLQDAEIARTLRTTNAEGNEENVSAKIHQQNASVKIVLQDAGEN